MERTKPSNIFFFLALTAATVSGQNTSLSILHTNNTNGALENCYCPDHPLGAMEKRVLFVEEFLKKNPNTIIVDAGDLLTVSHRDLKDSLMVEAYKLIPYDAILPGDQELTRGPGSMKSLFSGIRSPFIGTNIAVESLENMVSYRLLNKGGIRVAILGMLSPFALKYYPPEKKDKIQLRDPIPTITSTLDYLKNEVDVFILLTHQGASLDRKLAESVDGIDIIIGSHSQSVLREPEIVNGALIAQAGKEGYYIGVIDLLWDGEKIVSKSGRVEAMTQAMPDDPRVMKMINYYEDRTGHINLRKLNAKERK